MAWKGNEVRKLGYFARRRIPVGILCDISSSMEDVRDIINSAMRKLILDLKQSENLKKSVDLLVVFFNGDVELKVNFEPLENVNVDSLLIEKVCGYTDTGKALLEVERLLQEKKNEYKSHMIEYYQPKLCLLTDGYATAWQDAPDSEFARIQETYRLAADVIRRLEGERKLSFAAAGIQRKQGPSANMAKLRELSQNVVCVSENITEMNQIKCFFDLITPTLTRPDTDIVDIIHELFPQ